MWGPFPILKQQNHDNSTFSFRLKVMQSAIYETSWKYLHAIMHCIVTVLIIKETTRYLQMCITHVVCEMCHVHAA